MQTEPNLHKQRNTEQQQPKEKKALEALDLKEILI